MEIYKKDCVYYKSQVFPEWFGLDRRRCISCKVNKMTCEDIPLPYDPDRNERCPENCADYKVGGRDIWDLSLRIKKGG